MSFASIESIHPALLPALILCGAALAGYVIHRVVVPVASHVAKRTKTPVDDALVARLHRPVGLFLPSGAAILARPFAVLPDEMDAVLEHALIVLLTVATGWIVLGLLRAFSDVVVLRFRIDHADNLAERELQTRVILFKRIGEVIVVLATVALVLITFPSIRHLGVSLFASAGIAGIVIGLAARPTISNLIAGVQVALTQPIRVDDVVIVEGEWGWIEEITTTYVVVRIWDQRRLIVPLSQFIEKPFQNWTRKTADILGTVYLYADYTIPVEAVREELKRLVDGHPKWDGKVCGLQVTNTTDRAVELRALVSARNSGDAWDLRCDLREGLVAFLQSRYPECLPRVRADLDRDGNPANQTAIGGARGTES